MQALTPDGQQMVEAIAARHGFSADAVQSLLMAVAAGGGSQAQFNHWELGGMGQWSQGGMIMIGDMFNNGLKYRVDALCNDLSSALQNSWPFAPVAPAYPATQSQSQSQNHSGGGTSFFTANGGGFGHRWPAELGQPSSSGSQNDLHYAVFPETRRLALDQGGRISVYDTGDHLISGFSQAQGGGQSITFTSQHGLIRLSDLPQLHPGSASAAEQISPEPAPSAEPTPVHAAPASVAPPPAPFDIAPALSADEIFSRIERLAGLHEKQIITAEEFNAKKGELLARL